MVPVERIYEAGGCNISREEERLRLVAGWVGLVFTVAAGAVFVAADVSRAWRWFLILPGTLAAVGFLQARLHFCAQYGWRGVFNVNGPVGQTSVVEDAAARRRDRHKAQGIVVASLAIGVMAAALDVIL